MPSSTLVWAHSGLKTKTGTANADLINDIVSAVNSNSANAAFFWQVASSSTTNPMYVVLKRKDGSAGRILMVLYTSAPAGNNAAFLNGTPNSNALYTTWFPAGNVDTPSNLSSSSGTVLGNDTGALYVNAPMATSTVYGASYQVYYFDSAEALYMGFSNPASTAQHVFGAGKILVDSTDTEQDGLLGTGGVTLGSMANSSSPTFAWSNSTTTVIPSSIAPRIRSNVGAANNVFYSAYAPTGPYLSQTVGSVNDILKDTSINKVTFLPIVLLGITKNPTSLLKLRQLAFGPLAAAAFETYSITGPTVHARSMCPTTSGGSGGNITPWVTNFKV